MKFHDKYTCFSCNGLEAKDKGSEADKRHYSNPFRVKSSQTFVTRKRGAKKKLKEKKGDRERERGKEKRGGKWRK